MDTKKDGAEGKYEVFILNASIWSMAKTIQSRENLENFEEMPSSNLPQMIHKSIKMFLLTNLHFFLCETFGFFLFFEVKVRNQKKIQSGNRVVTLVFIV